MKASIRPESETPQRDGSLGCWSRLKHFESSASSVRDLSRGRSGLGSSFWSDLRPEGTQPPGKDQPSQSNL